mmetsp:Transcript_2276/g.4405  ORF Transcript_2276/g.4405 Transcript_2276/m.4405 type:complete len:215 (+) Transcript_2276:203-847(+)
MLHELLQLRFFLLLQCACQHCSAAQHTRSLCFRLAHIVRISRLCSVLHHFKNLSKGQRGATPLKLDHTLSAILPRHHFLHTTSPHFSAHVCAHIDVFRRRLLFHGKLQRRVGSHSHERSVGQRRQRRHLSQHWMRSVGKRRRRPNMRGILIHKRERLRLQIFAQLRVIQWRCLPPLVVHKINKCILHWQLDELGNALLGIASTILRHLRPIIAI